MHESSAVRRAELLQALDVVRAYTSERMAAEQLLIDAKHQLILSTQIMIAAFVATISLVSIVILGTVFAGPTAYPGPMATGTGPNAAAHQQAAAAAAIAARSIPSLAVGIVFIPTALCIKYLEVRAWAAAEQEKGSFVMVKLEEAMEQYLGVLLTAL